jgi:hypothetical protein
MDETQASETSRKINAYLRDVGAAVAHGYGAICLEELARQRSSELPRTRKGTARDRDRDRDGDRDRDMDRDRDRGRDTGTAHARRYSKINTQTKIQTHEYPVHTQPLQERKSQATARAAGEPT